HRASLVNAATCDPRQSGGMTDQPHDSVAPPPPPPALPRPPAPTSPAMTLASPPGRPAFHPRGMLVAKALGGPITRAGWIAGISAAVLVLTLSGWLPDRSSMLGVPVIAAIASVL